MEVTIIIKEKKEFELKIRSKSLISIVAVNKILSELKDIETLHAIMKQGELLKRGKQNE